MYGISRGSICEAARLAADSLLSSKLRTFLTLLGVILSAATLVVVSATGYGMKTYLADELSDLGATGFRIRRMIMLGEVSPREYAKLLRQNPELTRTEYLFLKRHVSQCTEMGLETETGATVRADGHPDDEWINLYGVTSNIAAIAGVQPSEGRYISDLDNNRRAAVAFLGDDIQKKLFSGTGAVQKTIRLYGRQFEVIGVAKKRGSAFGLSQDNFVMIPMETAIAIRRDIPEVSYMAAALDREHLEQAQDEVRMLLRSYRHLHPQQPDNFGVVSAQMISKLWDEVTGVTSDVVLAIIGVFLAVGGIVIMNTMLAIVSERTREIGIRKSVGATSVDILIQFLVEALLVAGVGGMFGVVCGWILAVLARNATSFKMVVPSNAVLLAMALSTSVGLLFGVFPAWRAAQLDPIEAIRAEK
jgi:putative ABC transport system permease protein